MKLNSHLIHLLTMTEKEMLYRCTNLIASFLSLSKDLPAASVWGQSTKVSEKYGPGTVYPSSPPLPLFPPAANRAPQGVTWLLTGRLQWPQPSPRTRDHPSQQCVTPIWTSPPWSTTFLTSALRNGNNIWDHRQLTQTFVPFRSTWETRKTIGTIGTG